MPRKAKTAKPAAKAVSLARAVTPAQVVRDLKRAHPSILLMGDGAPARVKYVCPTGLSVLDRWVLGIGGLAYGRVIELYGVEGAGKDTIMDCILAGAQRDGSMAALADSEHKWDPDWGALHGIDLKDLIWDQPDSTEQAHALIGRLVQKSTPRRRMVIALNSVAATPSMLEVEEGVEGEVAVGQQGRLWSHFMRVIVQLVAKHQAMLVLVNQVRSKIGVMYGNPEITPAGKAIKHHAYLRLNVSHGKFDDNKLRRYMQVTAFKNQCCPPMRTAKLRLDFTKGFDDRWSVLNYAKDVGCLPKDSQSYKEAVTNLGWLDLLGTAQPDEATPVIEGGDGHTEEGTAGDDANPDPGTDDQDADGAADPAAA